MGEYTVLVVFLVTCLPLVAVAGGAILATAVKLGPVTTSSIQHLAAGLVVAAVSIDLVPDMIYGSLFVPVIIGFVLGVTVMFLMEWFLERLESSEAQEQGGSPMRLLGAAGLDLVVDGFLIGVGFSASLKTGILLASALTLEVFFLGLACATELHKAGASRRRVILMVGGMGFLLMCSAVLAAWLLSGLNGAWLVGVASFGAAALLYLVAEELLVRAHSVPDTKRASALFFGGFLVIIVIDMCLSLSVAERDSTLRDAPPAAISENAS